MSSWAHELPTPGHCESLLLDTQIDGHGGCAMAAHKGARDVVTLMMFEFVH